MEKIKIDEVLKKNFHIKKISRLAIAGKKEVPVLVQYPGNVWFKSGLTAKVSDGKKVHRWRVLGDTLEFHFLGDPIEFIHSCKCERAYLYDNKIILPQGYGEGYVVITL